MHVGPGRRDAAPQQQDPALPKPHNRHKNPQRSPSLLFCPFAALEQKLIPLKKLSERKSGTKEAAPVAGSFNKTAGRAATLQLGCIGSTRHVHVHGDVLSKGRTRISNSFPKTKPLISRENYTLSARVQYLNVLFCFSHFPQVISALSKKRVPAQHHFLCTNMPLPQNFTSTLYPFDKAALYNRAYNAEHSTI